jgi:predicted nucleic acid-binding protein
MSFADRILDVDRTVAEAWGRMRARLGRPVPAIDSLIAATAEIHNLTVVTRNVADFAPLIARVFSPWETSEAH